MTEQERRQQLEQKMGHQVSPKNQNDAPSGVTLEVELPDELVRVADEAANFYAPLLQQYFVQQTLNKAFKGGILDINKSTLQSLNFKPLLALEGK